MNGFISQKALRFTLAASACLLTGFVSGANFSGINFNELFPKTEINYSKISWISRVIEEEKITLATVDYPSSEIASKEIKVDDFQLPRKIFFAKKSKPKTNNFARLNEVLAIIKESKVKQATVDIFEDYRIASQLIRKSFVLAVNKPAVKTESVVVAASSADQADVLPVVPAREEKTIEKKVVLVKKHKKPIQLKLNTQKMSTQTTTVKPVVVSKSNIETNRVAPEPLVIKTTSSSANYSNSIQEDDQKRQNESLGNKIENQLLEQHIISYQQKQLAQKPVQVASKTPKRVPEQIQPEDEVDPNNNVSNFNSNKTDTLSTKCKTLPELSLIKPIPKELVESTQICPAQNNWISKKLGIEEGWTKVETEGYYPLLTYYPQVNSKDALLLDQNSVAILSIKLGVKITHGMGMILGTLPAGYKVEFSGRAEEIQYFDHNQKKYFIYLNAEPGAGVMELISEKDPQETATVFTPVLGDVITYLDFAKPVTETIAIKVIKNGEKDKADLAGLSVAISTQTQIQTKTNANGLAILRNVHMVPGYPVYVDVSSKLNGERSYQYRYQLNERTRKGVFVLNQYSEKLIHHWLKQVSTNLSDQSAMIFGQFNRKRLDGFRKNYTVKVDAITENYGMQPINYTLLWDERLSAKDPLEGDRPRYLAVQVPEGLTQAHLVNEQNQVVQSTLIPVSPRVINVVSE